MTLSLQMGRAALAVRKDDFYETPPEATRALLRHEFISKMDWIWEPACGKGAISEVLRANGYEVVSTDLVDRGYGQTGVDFLMETAAPERVRTIVTNPPFKLADQFVRHGLTLVPRVIMLLRLAYLEGAGRADIHSKMVRVWLGRERLPFMHREGYDGPKHSNSGAPFAWFVFDRDPGHGPNPIELRHISWRSE